MTILVEFNDDDDHRSWKFNGSPTTLISDEF